MAGFVMGFLLELAWRARPRLVTAREVDSHGVGFRVPGRCLRMAAL